MINSKYNYLNWIEILETNQLWDEKMLSTKCLQIIYLINMYKEDLALNNR